VRDVPDPMDFDVDSVWLAGEAVRGARISVSGGRIAALRRVRPPGRGRHALPAFANAHCHLDLTSIGGEEMPHATFAEWVEALIGRRAALTTAAIEQAVASGAAELLAGGTAAVGDIDSFGASCALLRRTPLEGIAFRELLGRPDQAELARRVDEALRDDAPESGLRRGLTAHAPYSTAPEVYRACFAAARGLPVASHVAETREEEELLADGRGPLAALFARLRFTPPAWPAEGATSAVLSLAPADGALLVVHGNRLRADELAHCARRGFPVVYCPRSHRYFGHPPHPARALLEAGGLLALGTDSRASNAGLDLWAEMACFRAADPQVGDEAILAAATSAGRRALRLEPAELAVGQPATFQLVGRRDGAPIEAASLLAAAVRGELATRALFVRGELVAGSSDRDVAG
jgi:cytosine/adenosine deaminase-related metal-dependent hydrolase